MPGRAASLARNRRFLALWGAETASTLGDALSKLTLILMITATTHSVGAVAGLTIALALPGLVVGPLGGVQVDRWDRRRVMLVSDVARAVLMALLAWSTYRDGPWIPATYVVAFLHASFGTVFEPARAAFLQIVLPEKERLRANSLMQTTIVIGELVGVALAGVLAATSATSWSAFALDAVTFLVSAALVATIRGVDTRPPVESVASWRERLTDGCRAIRTSPTLRVLVVVFGALTFALSPMMVLLTPYVVDTLRISPAWLGPVQAGDAVGGVVGGGLVALAARRLRARSLVVVGMGGIAVVLIALAGVASVPGLVAAQAVFGFLVVATQSGVGTLMQNHVPNELMGRFATLLSVVPNGLSVISMAYAGSVATLIGTRTTFVISGAALAVTAVWTWRATRHPARIDRD